MRFVKSTVRDAYAGGTQRSTFEILGTIRYHRAVPQAENGICVLHEEKNGGALRRG